MIDASTERERKASSADSFVHSKSGNWNYIAFRLRNLIALTALGLKEIDYLTDYQKKSLVFLNSLLKPGDERLTYDFRLIATPDLGSIRVAR